jgi:hypothetical protein
LISSPGGSCAEKYFPGTGAKDNRDDLSGWRFSIRGENKTILSEERKKDFGS